MTMLLVLASAPAWALGLGQLQLKSKLGEPLLAEIPVISADPAELENLEARLAAPETFLRVGLPLPDKMVSDLRFALVYDAAGKPLIRVTSPGPVAMPMMTFLLEVDWGDGRLVREYSVLLAEPEAVAAATQPVIQAPVAAPSNTIVRSEPLPPPAPTAQPMQPTPTATPAPVARPPVPAAPVAPASPVATTTHVATATAAATAGSARRIVQAGDTLSGLAAQVRAPGQSINAVMAALLSANPDAFINNDPNLLRRGASLDLPAADMIAAATRDGSAAALQEQLAGWRSARSPRADAVDVASARDIAAAAPARAPASRRVRDARLEIMPAAASATAGAGIRSGTGGEGDAEMTQQLQEARETIATRDAEVAELKSRVTELENLQKQQAQLVQMKDSQLAAAQQQLQQRQQVSSTAAPPPASQGSVWMSAVMIGLPLLVLIGLGVWWARRRRPVAVDGAEPSFAKAPPPTAKPAPKPRPSDDANLFPPEHAAAQSALATPAKEAASTTLRKPSWMGVPAAGDVTLPPATPTRSETAPSFVASPKPVTPDAVPSIRNEPMPRELPPGLGVFDAPDGQASDISAAAEALAIDIDDERIALAHTYLELEDEATARQLLQDVIDENGASADEARRVLGSIGSPP
ncbi:MAG: fimbrial protein FimV [Xanthomonadaceae bacterium]|nr:fimbrial protein FimV [Xanthomonadaceae bacterium]